MNLYVIHHAEAVGAEVDPQRPLTEAGYEQARRLAEFARDKGAAPVAIWHSGKLRSRETGHAFLSICAPFAKFQMVRGLGPDDPPRIIQSALQAESHDVALVGHWPSLPALLRLLSPASEPMPQHGIVALKTSDHGLTWSEIWRSR